VVNGFLTICSGVVLLQLSKSAKDVPDAAVLAGDLDQIRTVAEQEQPETEPKADAIRGAAAIVRRFSSARQKMELEELKRLHQEKMKESLEPVDEQQQYEWDGLRRRRTGTFSSQRSRAGTSPSPFLLPPPTPHPPLGWSHFPTEEELAEANRPASPALSSIVGTIRTRARSVLLPGHPEFRGQQDQQRVQSPMHPVQLTEIAVPTQKTGEEYSSYYGSGEAHDTERHMARLQGSGASISTSGRHVQFGGETREGSERSDHGSMLAVGPTPPPHSARRQFSFQNVFKRHQAHGQPAEPRPSSRPGKSSRGYSSPHKKGASEEERLGLVQGDSRTSQSMPALPNYDGYGDYDDDDEEDDAGAYMDEKQSRYGPSITTPPRQSPPRRATNERMYDSAPEKDEVTAYQQQRQRFHERNRSDSGSGSGSGGLPRHYRRDSDSPPPPPPPVHRQYTPPRGGNGGAFI